MYRAILGANPSLLNPVPVEIIRLDIFMFIVPILESSAMGHEGNSGIPATWLLVLIVILLAEVFWLTFRNDDY